MNLLILVCAFMTYFAVEIRINDLQKSVKQIKDSLKRAEERLGNVEKSIIKEGKEQT